ncbi:MAG: hypothetical protein WCT99_04375 [Bacteroidota bacterium]|jgi:hypothetical protein
MKIFFSIILVCIVSAKTPEWVANHGKLSTHPELLYLTGYGIASAGNDITKEQMLNKALENAQKNLIEKIRVTIQSISFSKTEEISGTLSSMFSSAVQSSSNIEIYGMESFQYVDDEVAYAFVYLNREKTFEIYQKKIHNLRAELHEKLKLAKSFESKNNSSRAVEEYISCYPLIRQIKEEQSISSVINTSLSLNECEQAAAASEMTISEVQSSISALILKPIKTVEDLAWYALYEINEQLSKQSVSNQSIFIAPCLYQDTKMGSSFSRYFQKVMEQKAVEVVKWNPVAAAAEIVVSGSYWEQKGLLKFILTAKRITDGKIFASSEVTVDTSVIQSSAKDIKPENYLAAMTDMKIFGTDESLPGGLMVEGWTNREQSGNIFLKSDTMKVFVRVNIPSYIRFVYHMADGRRALLVDEYFIDQSKINLAYPIPIDFVCSEPFGSEVLHIIAQTEKFDQVEVETVDGNKYLKEDLHAFVTAVRGMKVAKPRSMQSEKRIIITTMEE